jgi:polyisoprenoid-binding protein YceI
MSQIGVFLYQPLSGRVGETMRGIRRYLCASGVVAVLFFAAGIAGGVMREIDVQKSSITVRAYKTGLFSAFAHDHEISAPIASGSFDEEKRTVEFKVDAREMKVRDPGASEGDRSQVQSTMLGPKVLDTGQYQEIVFRSTSVEPAGSGKWTVQGVLTLHGQTRPVQVQVEGESRHYRGSARLKQTDFGIAPVSIGGGTIKVKDEVRVDFEIYSR